MGLVPDKGAVQQLPELLIVSGAKPDGEVRALRGGQQLESVLSQPARGGQVDRAERGESAAEQIIERLVEDREYRDLVLIRHEAILVSLEEFYRHLSGSVTSYITGLSAWDQLHDGQRTSLSGTLHQSAPGLAVSRYEELFRRLVADFPEFSIWSNMSDHQATRTEIRNGLAGLQAVLESMASGRIPDQRWDALARAHLSALLKPIAPAGEVPADLRIPALGEGYIDHRIRVAEVGPSSEPGRDSWWSQVPVRDDACSFFAGYLTSPMA
jgi:hypothetical protein